MIAIADVSNIAQLLARHVQQKKRARLQPGTKNHTTHNLQMDLNYAREFLSNDNAGVSWRLRICMFWLCYMFVCVVCRRVLSV